MKIYRKVVISSEGKTVEEDSFEYHGKIALCKYGNIAAQKSSQAIAEKSYQQQIAQQEEEKKRLAEIKAMDDQKIADAALKAEQELQKKRKGSTSTILTGSDIGTPNINKKSLYA